jgi:hypothetical protein
MSSLYCFTIKKVRNTSRDYTSTTRIVTRTLHVQFESQLCSEFTTQLHVQCGIPEKITNTDTFGGEYQENLLVDNPYTQMTVQSPILTESP